MDNTLNLDTYGELFLVGTPIGNLEDMSLRALRILKEVNIIAAEDTRQTRKLLSYYEIQASLTSYHEHNKKQKGPELIAKIKSGLNIALVTDAGMPGISDPGEDLVRLAVEENIKVTAIPGPSASIAALVVSGLKTDKFIFEGFLPRRSKELKSSLESLSSEKRTIILYEAPHRLVKTLKELQKYLGERKLAVIREITKKFEESIRGNFGDVVNHFENQPPKGEFTLIIEGNSRLEGHSDNEAFEGLAEAEKEELIQGQVDKLIGEGLDKKEAFKEVAKLRGLSKREVYNWYLNKDSNKKNSPKLS